MSSVGLIGLGAIGGNLALNLQRSRDVHVYGRTKEKVDAVANKSDAIHGHTDMDTFISEMDTPRTIFTALPNGEATDGVVKSLLGKLDPNDTIIDCSNEHYRTSRKRGSKCRSKSVNYVGTGLSGGAFGALSGPALMIGCDEDVFIKNTDLFSSFCKNFTHMGNDYGVGHFTKMVHNGVEYGMLQGVADVYAYCNQDAFYMKQALDEAKKTDADGYIVNSALKVLSDYNISKILDVAEMNNTGSWTSQVAIEYGIPTPVLNAALNTRLTSRDVKAVNVNQHLNYAFDSYIATSTLRFVFAMALIEGFNVMNTRNVERRRTINAWSSGTIIECPMIAESCYDIIEQTAEDARVFVMYCTATGIPCPSVQAALTQFDFMHQRRTSVNFLMAQRNYFGQHSIIEK